MVEVVGTLWLFFFFFYSEQIAFVTQTKFLCRFFQAHFTPDLVPVYLVRHCSLEKINISQKKETKNSLFFPTTVWSVCCICLEYFNVIGCPRFINDHKTYILYCVFIAKSVEYELTVHNLNSVAQLWLVETVDLYQIRTVLLENCKAILLKRFFTFPTICFKYNFFKSTKTLLESEKVHSKN